MRKAQNMAERIDGVYLPRNPKTSPLFGLVDDYFDEFERVDDNRFAAKQGFWRPVILKVVNRFLDCGDLRHGFTIVHCENLDSDNILRYQCKQPSP